MRLSRRELLGAATAVVCLPGVARAALATRLVAVHVPGTLDPHRALHPLDGPTATYGELTVGIDGAVPETQAFFSRHADRVAVLRGLELGTEDPRRGRLLALSGKPDPTQPDVVTWMGRAVDFGSDAPGPAWRLGRRLSLGGWVEPTRASDAAEGPGWEPSPSTRAAIADFHEARGRVALVSPGMTPRPRRPGDRATLAEDAALVPGLLEDFDGVRLIGPDPETGLSELWEGLDVLLTALADSAWLDGTLVVVTADRGRDRDGLPSSGAAALVAGGPVLAGRAFDATGGTDLQVGGPGSARPGWGELWAGALAACGRSHALPGTASWTAWWS